MKYSLVVLSVNAFSCTVKMLACKGIFTGIEYESYAFILEMPSQ